MCANIVNGSRRLHSSAIENNGYIQQHQIPPVNSASSFALFRALLLSTKILTMPRLLAMLKTVVCNGFNREVLLSARDSSNN